jgi:hypothetical protein
MGQTKTCSRCGAAKPLSQFYEQEGGAQGSARDVQRVFQGRPAGRVGEGSEGSSAPAGDRGTVRDEGLGV